MTDVILKGLYDRHVLTVLGGIAEGVVNTEAMQQLQMLQSLYMSALAEQQSERQLRFYQANEDHLAFMRTHVERQTIAMEAMAMVTGGGK